MEQQQILAAISVQDNGGWSWENWKESGRWPGDSPFSIGTLHLPPSFPPSPQLMFERVIELADSSSAPNYSLLFLWASQANAIPESTTSSVSTVQITSSLHHHNPGRVLVSCSHSLTPISLWSFEGRCKVHWLHVNWWDSIIPYVYMLGSTH